MFFLLLFMILLVLAPWRCLPDELPLSLVHSRSGIVAVLFCLIGPFFFVFGRLIPLVENFISGSPRIFPSPSVHFSCRISCAVSRVLFGLRYCWLISCVCHCSWSGNGKSVDSGNVFGYADSWIRFHELGNLSLNVWYTTLRLYFANDIYL